MKYLVLPIYYITASIIWFIVSWVGFIIGAIIVFDFSKPKYKLNFWYNGNQTLTNVEFDSPWEWAILSIKILFKI